MSAKSAAAIARRSAYSRTYHRQRYASDHAFVERQLVRKRADKQALKAEALAAYGGPVCMDCGSIEFDRLTLDHVNGDGAEHRRVLTGDARQGGYKFYLQLKARGWPNDPPLRVLCGTCNHKKWVEEDKP